MVRIYQVDSFAEEPFSGNPAGVCLLPGPADETWMQNVAAEMNLSETAFPHPTDDGYALRWFTPTAEVELCGHGTLATAHVLWEEGVLPPDETARFHTASGLLTAERTGDVIELDFPARPPSETKAPAGLEDAVGAELLYVGATDFDYLLQVASEKVLLGLRPDLRAVAELPVRGVAVTARCESGHYDFVSRFFAPAVGVDEDPVTGSAHCSLAPFWCERLEKDRLTAYQASQRGGVVRLRVRGDRVGLGGRAVTVLRGELSA